MLREGMSLRTMLAMALLLCLPLNSLPVALAGTNQGRDPFDFRADKKLTAEEAAQLAALLRRLEDKKQSIVKRAEAAKKIGIELPHKTAIPALVKVVKDAKDDTHVRGHALNALSMIADKSVIPLLIEALSDPTPEIRGKADEQLRKLAAQPSPHGIRVDLPNIPAEELNQVINYWKEWWKKNEKTFKFNRARMFFSH